MTSLERATSVSSVSSVTSTSSIEATPFRLAPLGNVRAAYAAARARASPHRSGPPPSSSSAATKDSGRASSRMPLRPQAAPSTVPPKFRTGSHGSDKIDMGFIEIHVDSSAANGTNGGAAPTQVPAEAGTKRVEHSPARPIPGVAATIESNDTLSSAALQKTPTMYGASVGSLSSVNTARPSLPTVMVPPRTPTSSVTGTEPMAHPSRFPEQTTKVWPFRTLATAGHRSSMPTFPRRGRDVSGRTLEHSPLATRQQPSAGSSSRPIKIVNRQTVRSLGDQTSASSSATAMGVTTDTLRIFPQPPQSPIPSQPPLAAPLERTASPIDPGRTPTPHAASLPPAATAPIPLASNCHADTLNDPEPHEVDARRPTEANPYASQAEYWRQHLTPAEFVKWSALNPPPVALRSTGERDSPVRRAKLVREETSTPDSWSSTNRGAMRKRGFRTSHASSSQTVMAPQRTGPYPPPSEDDREQDQEADEYESEEAADAQQYDPRNSTTDEDLSGLGLRILNLSDEG